LTELQTLTGCEIEHQAGTEKKKLKRKERETAITEAEKETMIAEAEKETIDMIETVAENGITLGATRGLAHVHPHVQEKYQGNAQEIERGPRETGLTTIGGMIGMGDNDLLQFSYPRSNNCFWRLIACKSYEQSTHGSLIGSLAIIF